MLALDGGVGPVWSAFSGSDMTEGCDFDDIARKLDTSNAELRREGERMLQQVSSVELYYRSQKSSNFGNETLQQMDERKRAIALYELGRREQRDRWRIYLLTTLLSGGLGITGVVIGTLIG